MHCARANFAAISEENYADRNRIHRHTTSNSERTYCTTLPVRCELDVSLKRVFLLHDHRQLSLLFLYADRTIATKLISLHLVLVSFAD